MPRLTAVPPDLARRAMVVKRAQRIDIECIVRGYLAGSAWAEYSAQGTIFGQPAPRDLQGASGCLSRSSPPPQRWRRAHDQNMSIEEVVAMVERSAHESWSGRASKFMSSSHKYAQERGIIIADTKMEFGVLDGALILIDELLTPDSSRFWRPRNTALESHSPTTTSSSSGNWLAASGWNREPPAPGATRRYRGENGAAIPGGLSTVDGSPSH